MANWYSTYFETKDKDIIELIKNGETIDFYYDEEKGNGNCSLRWGLAALNVELIGNIATNNHSSFFIRSSDVLTGNVQTWAYENGKEKVIEFKKSKVEFV